MDRVKSIALAWDSNTYVFAAGAVLYNALADMEDWQLSSGKRHAVFNWLDLEFTISLGYLDQQLNAGTSYALQDGQTTISAAPTAGIITVLNALLTEEVELYPLLEDNAGGVNETTKYKVLLADGRQTLLDARTNGRFTPYTPIKLITQTPLSSYPTWLNR